MLRKILPQNIPLNRSQAFDNETLTNVRSMLSEIKANGDKEIIKLSKKFDGLDGEFIIQPADLKVAFDSLSNDDQALLIRTADRIRDFAIAQKSCLTSLKFSIPGGYAGHDILPIDVAGCYAPGGRFPLPSSVLMTVIPAKIAGVKHVIISSPKPTTYTLAAAYVAGADTMLCLGGVQAIGAFAYGTAHTPPVNMIVGPGNRWVTAAKHIVSEFVGIDMLAGPSELVVFADNDQDEQIIAADLLAQAEHDDDALPILITTSEDLLNRVNDALITQLKDLPTLKTAEAALKNGFAVVTKSVEEAIDICNRLAPEHLQILARDATSIAPLFTNAGGIFIGKDSAEVIGDYGAGPNHTLPTGGTAKFTAGLSVFAFMRMRTWINIEDNHKAQILYNDSMKLGMIEGLEAHSRAAKIRKG
jgi:histidinol dehydrogenase